MIRRINPILAGALAAAAIVVFIGVSAVAGALLLGRVGHDSSPTSTSTPTVSPETAALLTQVPLALSPYEFATDAIDYPDDWPDSLIFPEGFVLVEASSGGALETASVAHTAKLRYRGEPTVAATQLTEFLLAQGWQIIDRTEVESTQVALFFVHPKDSRNGMAILEQDISLPGSVKILLVVSP